MPLSEFELDVLERKRLSGQSRHMKRGSRSKKCPLSTDHMTEKQWKERNGEVVYVNMTNPVSWAVFKELSKDVQEGYLKKLAAEYGANMSNFAELFQVSRATVARYVEAEGFDLKFQRGKSMNARQRALWAQFLGVESDAVLPAAQDEAADDDAETPADPIQADTDSGSARQDGMRMERFSISFSGEIDVEMVANSLRHMLGEGASGVIEISCTLDQERG